MEEEVAAAPSQQQTEQQTQQQTEQQQTEPSVSSPPKLPATFPGPNTVLVNVSGTRYSVGELQIQIANDHKIVSVSYLHLAHNAVSLVADRLGMAVTVDNSIDW